MKILKFLDDYFEEIVVAVIFSFITLIGFQQVFTRYVLGFVFSWSEELMRFCFVWLSLISFSLCQKKLQHIKVEAVTRLLPVNIRLILGLVVTIISSLFCLYMIKYTILICLLQYHSGQVTPAMNVPTWTYYISGPIGFSLLLYRIIQKETFPLILTIREEVGKKYSLKKKER